MFSLSRSLSTGCTALLLAAAASLGCGDDDDTSSQPPDASTVDASTTDGSPPDATPVTTVTVKLVDDWDAPAPFPEGVPVLTFTPEGALIEEFATDAEGEAVAQIVPGGTVAVLLPDAVPETEWERNRLLLAFGVSPGDLVVFGDVDDSDTELDSMTIEAPADPPVGTVWHRFDNGCMSDTTESDSEELQLEESCVIDGEFDVLVGALDDDDQPLAFAWAHGPYVAGGTLTIDGPWVLKQDFALEITSLPSTVEFVYGSLASFIGAREYTDNDTSDDLTASSTGLIAHPTKEFGDSRLLSMEMYPTEVTHGDQEQHWRLGADATSFEVTEDIALLPFYGEPNWVAATRSASWSASPGDAPDYISGDGYWTTAETSGYFDFIVPGDASSFVVPELPAAYASYLPTTLDSIDLSFWAVEAPFLDSYGDALHVGLEYGHPEVIDLAIGERLRYSDSGEGLAKITLPSGPPSARASKTVRAQAAHKPMRH